MSLWLVVLSGGTISSPPTLGPWEVEFSGNTISPSNDGKMVYLWAIDATTTTTTTSDITTTTTTTQPFSEICFPYLYNYFAISDARNITPSGWHIPTETELNTLVSTLGGVGVAGAKMRDTDTNYWEVGESPTNSSELTIRGTGTRTDLGVFNGILINGYLMSSTLAGSLWRNYSLNNSDNLSLSNVTQKQGRPIILLKDDSDDSLGYMLDNDGNKYHITKIGTQVFMTIGLITTSYRNGDPIPNVTAATGVGGWDTLSTGAYSIYNNSSDGCSIITTTTTTVVPITTTTTTIIPTTTTTTIVPTTTTSTTTVTPTTTTTTTTIGPVECLNGLVIETIYLGQGPDRFLLKTDYSHPCSDMIGVHSCDRAFFEIFGNDIYIGDSLMNNLGGTTGDVTRSGKQTCYDYNNHPDEISISGTWTGSSNSRYSKNVLTTQQAQDIAAAAGGSTIDFSLVSTMLTYDVICNDDPLPHTDITWTRISDNTGELLYNGCPNGNFITLDVCYGNVTINIVGAGNEHLNFIFPSDTIETLPNISVAGGTSKLIDDGTDVLSVPHTVVGDVYYSFSVPLIVSSFTDSFTWTSNNRTKTININWSAF